LSRISKEAFFRTGLIEIIISSSVEILGEICFYQCKSLSLVRFESGLRLSRIENGVFLLTGLDRGISISKMDEFPSTDSSITKITLFNLLNCEGFQLNNVNITNNFII
jgi:hypothetical protein